MVTVNNPLYRVALSRPGGPSGSVWGSSTGGTSTPFSPVSIESSSGNAAATAAAARGGAAAAEASADPPGSNTGGSSPPKAATMLARFRNAASIFSRRATVASDRPLPPAPDAGPAEPAPRSEAAAGNFGSKGSNLPRAPAHKPPFESMNGGKGLPTHKSVFESGNGGTDGDALPAPIPMGPDYDKSGGGTGGGKEAPAFGDGGFLGKTPMVSPLPSPRASPATSRATTPRREAEGDVEEGGARAAVADGGVATVAVATEPGASQIVLPCAPSDEEKVTRGVLFRR